MQFSKNRVRRVGCVLAAAAGSMFSSLAWSVERSWINTAGGTFSVAANWLNGIPPAANDTAVFDLGGSYSVTFTTNVSNINLSVRNDTVTFALGGFTLTPLTGGFTGGISNDISRLTITNGTLSLPTASQTTIGGATGLRQTLTISTTGTLSTATQINVGDTGEGSLVVVNGGTVNAGTIDISRFNGGGESGTMTVSGLTSSATTTGLLEVGGKGQGFLSVTGGGKVTAGLLRIAEQTNSSGTVTVSGADSSFTVTGNVEIGTSGSGFLRIDTGASVTTNGCLIGNGGGANAAGSVVVDGLGTSWTSGTLSVGAFAVGSLSISNAATVSSATVSINNSAVVSGTGSKWTTGQIDVDGGLDILSGGVVTMAGAGAITAAVGAASGGHGSVHVSGSNSIWIPFATDLGSNGNGDLIVEDRGTAFPGPMTLGTNATGFGTATVRDAGSLISTSTLTVGNSGGGVLVAENGGHFQADATARVGNLAGSSGTIRVSGSGSRFTAPQLTVGQSGSGDLIVENGGFVSVANTGTLNVGSTSTGHGDITVTGPGSVLSVGTMNLGQTSAIPGGTATLRVADGGVVNISSGFSIFTQNSTVTIEDGTINAPAGVIVSSPLDIFGGLLNVAPNGTLTISTNGRVALHSPDSRISGGTIVLNSSTSKLSGTGQITGSLQLLGGAEISVDGGDALHFSGALTNTVNGKLTMFNGGLIDFANPVTLTTAGRLSGRGTFRSGGLTNSGTISLSGGSSDIFGPVTNNATARAFVTGNSVATFYDNLINNAGSAFQVSAGSTAVFFGNVTGLGAFTGTGVKDFEGGVSINGPLQTQTGDSIVGGPASVTTDFVREHALTVSGRVDINPNGTNSGVSRLNLLTIDGGTTPIGTLNLSDNDLVIDYATNESTPRPMIEAQIAYARDGGNWDRPGLTSSTALASNPRITTLGVLEGSQYRVLYGTSATFSGQSVDDSSILVKYTYYGDTDFNGKVDGADYARVDTTFNNETSQGNIGGWLNGDLDFNGKVDGADYALIDSAFNAQGNTILRMLDFVDGTNRNRSDMTTPGLQLVLLHFDQFGESYAASVLSSIPEPASIISIIVASGSSALRGRRRSRQRNVDPLTVLD